MYSKVVIGEYGEDNRHQASEVLINPECPIRIIYDYIQEWFNIDCDLEFDLCDENGNLVFIYEKEPWSYGTECLTARSTYFVVLFERDEENRVVNPMLYVPEFFRKSSAQLNEMMLRIKKQLNPVQSSKGGRASKTRSTGSTSIPK